MAQPMSRFALIVGMAVAVCTGSTALAQANCADCGTVQTIRYIEEEGRGSGVGAVAGGVLGGVLGHQIGGGTGNTVATIAGAAGGAYVGNKVEKNKNAKSYWTVTINMDGGKTRTFTYSNQPTVKEGERVKLVDGGRRLALLAN
jgi:outer membrane lipoprotein SlyB